MIWTRRLAGAAAFTRSLIFYCCLFAAAVQPFYVIAAPTDAIHSVDLAKRLVAMVEQGEKYGSGIIVGISNNRLYIVTARHLVVDSNSQVDRRKFTVYLSFMPGEQLEATASDETSVDLDLAVLVVNDIEKKGVRREDIPLQLLGNPTTLARQDDVYVIGNPHRHRWELPGRPDGIQSVGNRIRFQSGFIRAGHSGGGLFDRSWNLVGMVIVDSTTSAIAVPINQILTQLKEWNIPVNLEMVDITHPMAFRFLRLKISQVDYLPPLAGFLGRNRVVLALETPSSTIQVPIEVGTTATQLIKIGVGDVVDARLVELGVFQSFDLTDIKSVSADELTGEQQYQFRLLSRVFRENPEIDPRRRNVNFVLTGLPFDPDEKSGAGREATGAAVVKHGAAYTGRISVFDQVATTHFKLAGDTGRCRSIIWTENTNGIELGEVGKTRSANLQLISEMEEGRVWLASCNKGVVSILRLHATEPNSATSYLVAIIEPDSKDQDFKAFLRAFIDSESERHEAAGFARLLANLRKELGVSLKAMVEFVDEETKGGTSEPKGRILASMLETEILDYERAVSSCCTDATSAREVIAVIQAAIGNTFERKHLQDALYSPNEWLAIMAIDALGKAKDTGYAREILKGLLIDKREPIALRARQVLLNQAP
jgi:hypothetical protein